VFEANDFIKTLLFCANFLRKMTKIMISDQLLYFALLCTLFQTCIKHIAYKRCLTVFTDATLVFASTYFTKTLLFCANFLRKMTKISISDQLTVV
jgi:hypothetical protein